MTVIEIRDPDAARDLIAQGLWLQRAAAPVAARVRPILECTLEIVSSGHPLPPTGFLADLYISAYEPSRDATANRDLGTTAGLPTGLIRRYEDHVLGKLAADWTIDRAADVLRRLQGRDRYRGLAYVVNRIYERNGADAVALNPAVVKTLAEASPIDILNRSWDTMSRKGVLPVLVGLYESLITSTRKTADSLTPEDVFELEHGTALAELGQRIALRQLLRVARRLENELPARPARPRSGPKEVPTRVFDEDAYPVGGFSSLSNRGSLESLLHSQLAYMELAPNVRPDLFDAKYLRDELLYYARDENQFLRRRRTFVVVLAPDLVLARFKDVDLPTQRIILAIGLLVAAVRRLSAWLDDAALRFEFLFLADGEVQPLAQERELLSMVFREPIANGTLTVEAAPDLAWVVRRCAERSRRSLCHALTIGVQPPQLSADHIVVSRLAVTGAQPALLPADEDADVDDDDLYRTWTQVLHQLMARWM